MNNIMKYGRLMEIYKNVKPFRNTNQYPYWNRGHRHKYFVPREVNGKIEFQIGYGYNWARERLTQDEFNEKKKYMGKRELDKWALRSGYSENGEDVFVKYIKVDRFLGIVRDDNTFEFDLVSDYDDTYHQGDRYILSGGGGWFQTSSKHGGCIYIQRNGYSYEDKKHWAIMPIFKGLRVDMDTMKPTKETEYEVITKKVDRKKAKETMNEYIPSFTLCETMYKVMDNKTFVDDFVSVLKEHNYIRLKQKSATGSWWSSSTFDELRQIAREKFMREPIVASYLMLKSMALYGINYISDDDENPTLSEHYKPINYYNSFKTYMTKQLYLERDTFTRNVERMPNHLKSSSWGVEVVVNDKLMSRY